MSDEAEEESSGDNERGIPAWVMTFADLMSLLMCFFVLLLAFSEMDALKYKQLAGSMSEAFGVQNQVKLKDIPKGTSVIAQEFSPGKPKPTPLNDVRQFTMDMTKPTLELDCKTTDDESGEESQEGDGAMDADLEELAVTLEMKQIQDAEADTEKVKKELADEIKNGRVEVESRGKRVVIRIKDNGSFPSGSATLREEFLPIMAKMRDVVKTIPGKFYIEGHTDDIPINTPRFRSNWELSSSRAVSVAHELFKDDAINPERFTVVGYGDTKPLVPNQSRFARAKNRRVEIIIERGPEPDNADSDLFNSEDFEGDTSDIEDRLNADRIQEQVDEIIDPDEIEETIREAEAREAPPVFDFSPDEIF
jgi:chemotaxis protein MotB